MTIDEALPVYVGLDWAAETHAVCVLDHAGHQLAAFTVEPQVVIDNTLSDALTVIEINGLDRPGLLYDVTREISDLNLDIASAHVATFGEKAVDVFYVTDLTGKKITSATREASIRERLMKALQARERAPLIPAS